MERGDKESGSLLPPIMLQCGTLLSSNFLPHGFFVLVGPDLAGHHVAELGELDLPGPVSVELVDHLQQLRLGGIHPHGPHQIRVIVSEILLFPKSEPHSVAQLPCGDGPATISVKQIECLSEREES